MHIKSLTGKYVEPYTYYPEEEEVLFAPYTYFLVTKVEDKGKYREYWMEEIPSPSFKKDITLWVDDEPFNNLYLIDYYAK